MQPDETMRLQTAPASAPVEGEAPAEAEEEAEGAHVHLSPQSAWPITMAAGIALIGGGAVTMWPVSFLGLALWLLALVNWIQELRHEQH